MILDLVLLSAYSLVVKKILSTFSVVHLCQRFSVNLNIKDFHFFFSNRFLKVHPSMPDDESLLQEVLRFISMALRLSGEVTEGTLQALGEVLYQPSGPLIGLSHRTSVRGETRDVPENVNIKRWDIELNRIFLQGMYLVLGMICRCSFNFESSWFLC